eukprot:1138709-Pelagomonas_calceolata.AAC.6
MSPNKACDVNATAPCLQNARACDHMHNTYSTMFGKGSAGAHQPQRPKCVPFTSASASVHAHPWMFHVCRSHA